VTPHALPHIVFVALTIMESGLPIFSGGFYHTVFNSVTLSSVQVNKSFITYGHDKTLREIRCKFHGNKGRGHGSQLARLKQMQ
jgi:hypothetical protein